MQSAFRVAACVGSSSLAASLRHPRRRDPQSRSRPKSSFSSATMLFAEGRYADALDAYQQRAERGAARPTRAGRACGVIASALRVAEFDLARTEAETLRQGDPARRRRRWRSTPTRCGRPACSRRPRRATGTRWRSTPELAARPPRHGARARGAQPARRGDGRGAGGAAARRRATSRSTTPSAPSTSGCTSTRRRPARSATTSTCCRTRTTATRPTGRASEIKFLRSFGQRVPFEMDPGTDEQLYTVDFRLVNDKVVVRAKVNDGSFQDFVVDTGAENTVISRGRRRSGSASRRSPTRSAPASATSGCAACSSRGSTRSSSAR